MSTKHRTIVINLIGGPGCGKSTMAAVLFTALKLRGYVVEYVQEFAKRLVWTKQFSRLNNQHYVTTKQYEILREMNGAVDFIVTDGPLIHGLYYNLFNPDNTSDKDKTAAWILKCAGEFHNLNAVLIRGEFKYEAEGRLQTEEQARGIDGAMQHVLDLNQVHYQKFGTGITQADIDAFVKFAEVCRTAVENKVMAVRAAAVKTAVTAVGASASSAAAATASLAAQPARKHDNEPSPCS